MYLTLISRYSKGYQEQLSSIPNRKNRNLELSQEEKEHNKNHSIKRIVKAYFLQIEKVPDNE